MTPEVEAFAKQKGLRLTADYEAMLAHDIDAVVLATPHSMHATQVMAAAAAKKHVYCEKPFTLTKREAEDAVAAVKKSGVTLAVGYNRRFHPEMTKLRDMIRAGELGTILHVEATMTFPNALFINPAHWRADKAETPLGGLMPMGVHAIDGMIDLCGPIDHAFAQSFRRAAPIDADDTTSILVRMKEGMSGYLGTMTTTGPGFSFQVFGSKGLVRLEGLTHVAGASSEERRMRLFGNLQIPAGQRRRQGMASGFAGRHPRRARGLRQSGAGRAGLSNSVRSGDCRRRRHRSDHPLGRLRQGGEGGVMSVVIPGPNEARDPESITPALGLWIPGSPLRGAPE